MEPDNCCYKQITSLEQQLVSLTVPIFFSLRQTHTRRVESIPELYAPWSVPWPWKMVCSPAKYMLGHSGSANTSNILGLSPATWHTNSNKPVKLCMLHRTIGQNVPGLILTLTIQDTKHTRVQTTYTVKPCYKAVVCPARFFALYLTNSRFWPTASTVSDQGVVVKPSSSLWPMSKQAALTEASRPTSS